MKDDRIKNAPTYGQLRMIRAIENDFGVKFTGTTSNHAGGFIRRYLSEPGYEIKDINAGKRKVYEK